MVDVPENFSMNPEQLAQMQNQTNPLHKYLRQPQIYVKLPSMGKYWIPGTLDMPVSSELPVLPMSTRDEIMLNTPDALLNGEAVVGMIQSCVPNIRNAWALPSVDLDTILIAIRIASYGEQMEYTSSCPECENSDNYEIDLRQFLDMPVDLSGYENAFEYKGITVSLKPLDYNSINQQNLEQFEQQRLITMVNDTTIDEATKQARFQEIFKILTEYTLKNVTGSIEKLTTPEGITVLDPNHIQEFVENSERILYKTIRDKLMEVKGQFPEKSVTTTCDSCQHEYTTPFTFDQANFFEFAS